MEYPNENSKSLYDYSDKSAQHAGYAAIVYSALNVFGALLALIQYFIYHTPGRGGLLNRDFASQQWFQHTPLLTAVAVAFSLLIATISGVFAFFIFRRSRFAVIGMLVFVIALQIYVWLAAHALAGTLVSIIVVGFLARGARQIFQDHTGRQEQRAKKASPSDGGDCEPSL